MSLEQRVQVVEKELDLLKAQIQVTLLKIQEHLLNSTYPALNTQEQPVAVTRKQSLEEIRTPAAPPAPAPKKLNFIDPKPKLVMDDDDPLERLPMARNVVRMEEPSRFAPKLEQFVEPEELEEAEQEAMSRTWMELDKWVSQKVREIGLERTRELITVYGGKERELLLRVVDVYDQNAQGSSASAAPLRKPKTATPNRPFNDHQELLLRLISEILSSGAEQSPIASNGHVKH